LINHETCTYLSPEQFDGRCRSQLSDQYALGLIGRELLSGERIERVARPADFVRRPQLFREFESCESWGVRCPPLAGIISRMLRVDPGQRWSSMKEVFDLLTDLSVVDTEADRLRQAVVNSYSQLQIGDGQGRFYESFYRHLFDLVPAIRHHFPTNAMSTQYVALNRALKLLLDFSPDQPETVAAIRDIARHHAKYHLGPEHLDAFREALARALSEVGHCEPPVLDAWQKVVGAGLDEMRRALVTPGPLDLSTPSSEELDEPVTIPFAAAAHA
jgi:eukaryotic-like serine/threonine-protein kinase